MQETRNSEQNTAMPSETREKSRFYQRPEWWLGGPFLFFGVIILLCGLARSSHELYICATGERAEAIVCRLQRKYSQARRSAYVYTPVFRFTDTQGQSHTIANTYGSSNFADMKVGTKVTITYLSKNPERLVLHHRETGFYCFALIAFGGIFAAAGGGILYLFMRNKNAGRV